MTDPERGDAWLRRYEQVLRLLRVELGRLREQILPTLESPIPAEVGLLGGALTTTLLLKLREALIIIDSCCERATMLLQCASLPVRFVDNAGGWYRMEHQVGMPDKELLQHTAVLRLTWQGSAADAYLDAAAAQSMATGRLATACAATADALVDAAGGAEAFYAALLLLLTTGAAQLSIAADAVRSVVRLPAALGAVGAAIELFGGLPGLLDLTRAAFGRTAQAVQAISLQLLDVTVFPDGGWPRSGSPSYADGSVTDGDPSDWSIKHAPRLSPHLPR